MQDLRFSQWSWWKIMLPWEVILCCWFIFGYQLFKGASVSRIEEGCCTEMPVHQYQSTIVISLKTGSFPLWCHTFCMYTMYSVMPTIPNAASAHAQPSLRESWFNSGILHINGVFNSGTKEFNHHLFIYMHEWYKVSSCNPDDINCLTENGGGQ